MKTEDFNYLLPEEMIAQFPLKDRDYSKLLVLDKKSGNIEHKHFYDICVDALVTVRSIRQAGEFRVCRLDRPPPRAATRSASLTTSPSAISKSSAA